MLEQLRDTATPLDLQRRGAHPRRPQHRRDAPGARRPRRELMLSQVPAPGAPSDEHVRALPKVELHVHVEGAAPPHTIAELARKNGVDLGVDDPAELYRYDGLAGFLRVYDVICRSLQHVDDIHRVTYEALAIAAAAGVRYREMFFSPTFLLRHGVPFDTIWSGITAGIEDAATDHAIVCRMILDVDKPSGRVPRSSWSKPRRGATERCSSGSGAMRVSEMSISRPWPNRSNWRAGSGSARRCTSARRAPPRHPRRNRHRRGRTRRPRVQPARRPGPRHRRRRVRGRLHRVPDVEPPDRPRRVGRGTPADPNARRRRAGDTELRQRGDVRHRPG